MQPQAGETWRHKNNTKEYQVVRVCEAEDDDFLVKSPSDANWSSAISYTRDGMTFIRTVEDFLEKFEPANA